MDTHILFIFSQINYFFMFIILVLSNKGQKYCTMTHVGYNGGVMDRVSYHELTLLLLLSSSVLWECRWSACVTQTPPHHNTYCQLACAIANEAPPRQTADVLCFRGKRPLRHTDRDGKMAVAFSETAITYFPAQEITPRLTRHIQLN